MPINVFSNCVDTSAAEEKSKSLAWLCDETWDLSAQLFEFERWLEKDGQNLPKGSYIADIGFSARQDASGGGGILSVSAMQTLVTIGMEMWFSEYCKEQETT
ncbi:hypothetical protein [Halocynthiibacter styelae]|uniref:Uncharacterized protein n=1 Tax=Halocynthiibacter styelae TaxID=2761955 RepID=A0A8J7IMF2_9RHOB|nr:hypothetical protein [Paenihalocynthiibacter styelae]MBI1493276.1 hypothetical protein [Paenihalocynthiibacter styelae]